MKSPRTHITYYFAIRSKHKPDVIGFGYTMPEPIDTDEKAIKWAKDYMAKCKGSIVEDIECRIAITYAVKWT